MCVFVSLFLCFSLSRPIPAERQVKGHAALDLASVTDALVTQWLRSGGGGGRNSGTGSGGGSRNSGSGGS